MPCHGGCAQLPASAAPGGLDGDPVIIIFNGSVGSYGSPKTALPRSDLSDYGVLRSLLDQRLLLLK